MNKKEELKATIVSLNKTISDSVESRASIQKELDSMPDKRWRSDEGGWYFYKDDWGETQTRMDNRLDYENYHYKTGNQYATEEECEADTYLEAITALRDHVREYGEIKEGERYYHYYGGYWNLLPDFELSQEEKGLLSLAGLLMSATATEEQKTERLRLIKKLIK